MPHLTSFCSIKFKAKLTSRIFPSVARPSRKIRRVDPKLSVPALRQVWLYQVISRLAVIADPSSHQWGVFVINQGVVILACVTHQKRWVFARTYKMGIRQKGARNLKITIWRVKIIIYPPALFEVYEIGKNPKFLLALINKKWPPSVDPGGHRFVD